MENEKNKNTQPEEPAFVSSNGGDEGIDDLKEFMNPNEIIESRESYPTGESAVVEALKKDKPKDPSELAFGDDDKEIIPDMPQEDAAGNDESGLPPSAPMFATTNIEEIADRAEASKDSEDSAPLATPPAFAPPTNSTSPVSGSQNEQEPSEHSTESEVRRPANVSSRNDEDFMENVSNFFKNLFNNKPAGAALVLSVLVVISIFSFPPLTLPLGIAALLTGLIGRRISNQDPEKEGRMYSLIGIITGASTVIVVLALMLFLTLGIAILMAS